MSIRITHCICRYPKRVKSELDNELTSPLEIRLRGWSRSFHGISVSLPPHDLRHHYCSIFQPLPTVFVTRGVVSTRENIPFAKRVSSAAVAFEVYPRQGHEYWPERQRSNCHCQLVRRGHPCCPRQPRLVLLCLPILAIHSGGISLLCAGR